MTAPINVSTPRQYFDVVVKPDVDDFDANRTDLRLAYHACTSLLGLRDWIFEAKQGSAWTYNAATRTPFTSKKDLYRALESFDAVFSVVFDVANASKHMVLKRDQAYTPLWGNANTVVQTAGGPIASSPVASTPIAASVSKILVQIGPDWLDVFDHVRRAFAVLSKLMDENGW